MTELKSDFINFDTLKKLKISSNGQLEKIGLEIPTRLIPLTAWPRYYPWPSIPGLRFLVQHAQRKKFLPVFKKLNGRILIDETAFFLWAEATDEKEISPEIAQ